MTTFDRIKLVTIGFLALLPATSITAQQAPQSDIQDLLQESQLDHKQRQMADRYLEALEQLEIVLDDYGDYFDDVDLASLKAYQISFDQFSRGIERGTYAKNPSFLIEDLGSFIDHLEEQNQTLSRSDSRDDRKLRKLLKGLRRELSIVLDLVESSMNRRVEMATDFEDLTQEYLRLSLEMDRIRIEKLDTDAFAKQYRQAVKIYLSSMDNIDDSALIKALIALPDIEELQRIKLLEDFDALEGMDQKIQQQILSALEGFEVTYTDDGEPIILFHQKGHLPPLPPTTPTPQIGYIHRPSSSSREKLLSASLGISSPQTPIYITQPLGELIVEGYDDDIVVAQLSVSVEASSESERNAFLESIKLKMDMHTGSYYVEAIFPQLSDPNTRIIDSRLEIKVPSRNRVIANQSFGSAEYSGLNRGALIKGNNSTITIANIKGKLRVENRNGPVTIDFVTGSIQATNVAAEIFISSSKGRVRAGNKGGLISIHDSEGDLILSNSGPVNVVDHIGNIDIDNRNGSITILNVEGNISAYSTLKPLVVENIIGEVILENSHGEVGAFEIIGPLEIRNNSANITVEQISGPVNMVNDHADIRLSLGDQLVGLSKVSTNSGLVSLVVPKTANLLLKMEAIEGKIKSSYELNLNQQDGNETGQLKLGSPKGSITVKTSHSGIVVKQN